MQLSWPSNLEKTVPRSPRCPVVLRSTGRHEPAWTSATAYCGPHRSRETQSARRKSPFMRGAVSDILSRGTVESCRGGAITRRSAKFRGNSAAVSRQQRRVAAPWPHALPHQPLLDTHDAWSRCRPIAGVAGRTRRRTARAHHRPERDTRSPAAYAIPVVPHPCPRPVRPRRGHAWARRRRRSSEDGDVSGAVD